jgi:hypothetical protein
MECRVIDMWHAGATKIAIAEATGISASHAVWIKRRFLPKPRPEQPPWVLSVPQEARSSPAFEVVRVKRRRIAVPA